MSGYIRLRKDLVDDPRLLELAEALEEHWRQALGSDALGDALGDASRHALLGVTVTLWGYADTHIRDDDTLPVKVGTLAKMLRFPVAILKKFPADWLEILRDGTVRLPGYREKNGLISREKRKEAGRERTRRWRESRAGGDGLGDASRDGHGTDGDASQAAATPSPSPFPSPVSQRLRSTSSESLPTSLSGGLQGGKTIERRETKRRAVQSLVRAVAAEKALA